MVGATYVNGVSPRPDVPGRPVSKMSNCDRWSLVPDVVSYCAAITTSRARKPQAGESVGIEWNPLEKHPESRRNDDDDDDDDDDDFFSSRLCFL